MYLAAAAAAVLLELKPHGACVASTTAVSREVDGTGGLVIEEVKACASRDLSEKQSVVMYSKKTTTAVLGAIPFSPRHGDFDVCAVDDLERSYDVADVHPRPPAASLHGDAAEPSRRVDRAAMAPCHKEPCRGAFWHFDRLPLSLLDHPALLGSVTLGNSV